MIQAIILAAGQGSRLRPLTDDRPKCMVEYQGKPIIDHILETMRRCGVENICLVKGYKHEVLLRPGIQERYNSEFSATNMVHTLFCAEDLLSGDTIVSYADIVYRPDVLTALLDAEGDFCVAVDRRWRELWSRRMADPLADAETMKLNNEGYIVELGKKPASYEEIQGQYIGLFKISGSAIQSVRRFYHSLDRNGLYDGKDFRNMYMTSFIQLVIDRLMPVKAVLVDGGWHEIDSPSDLSCEPVGGLAASAVL